MAVRVLASTILSLQNEFIFIPIYL